MNLDFAKMFDEFFTGGDSTSAVKEVYNIIPTFRQEQLNILAAYWYYAEKYDLEHIREFIKHIIQLQEENKNLSFFQTSTASKLLKAYTLEDMMGRVKPQISHVEEQQRA